jgi:hypothetical protein
MIVDWDPTAVLDDLAVYELDLANSLIDHRSSRERLASSFIHQNGRALTRLLDAITMVAGYSVAIPSPKDRRAPFLSTAWRSLVRG